LSRIILTVGVACLLAACGGSDSTGPSGGGSFAGTYNGTFYITAISNAPAETDSASGGAVTLTLTGHSGDAYTVSVTSASGGSSADININSAGAVSFPAFDPVSSRALLQSFVAGVCDLSAAVPVPDGAVSGRHLQINYTAAGGVCDWGAGTGTPDVRTTLIRLSWQGTR
jgi:hypothetical protein